MLAALSKTSTEMETPLQGEALRILVGTVGAAV
jgi:hypothetical protein